MGWSGRNIFTLDVLFAMSSIFFSLFTSFLCLEKRAFNLENSASEIHYQSILVSKKDSELTKIFKALNGNDMDHAKRIKNYMNKLNC